MFQHKTFIYCCPGAESDGKQDRNFNLQPHFPQYLEDATVDQHQLFFPATSSPVMRLKEQKWGTTEAWKGGR